MGYFMAVLGLANLTLKISENSVLARKMEI